MRTGEDETATHQVERARFLRIGAGAAVAAGIVSTGRAPAFAERSRETVRTWTAQNRHRLPERYDEVVAYP